jgi:thiosulfate dehydrogenase [quinone] large subunit
MPSEELSPELTRRAAGRARRAARRRARGLPPEPVPTRESGSVAEVPPSPERRLLLETGLLAGLTAVLTSLALPLRAFGLVAEAPASPAPSIGPIPGGSGSGAVESPGATPGASAGTAGLVVAQVLDVAAGGGSAAFTVPFNAPSPLPPGDPGVIVQLANGTFVAFDAICTHAGCTVEWDQPDALLVCPCHSAAFDPAHGAEVVGGPAPSPLTSLPIVVDPATGAISLAG